MKRLPLRRLTVVVPVYNEEENLPVFYSRLSAVMQECGYLYELILVDDGSRDKSRPMIESFVADDPRVRGIVFSRNFGHQAAIAAGIDHAEGDAVVVLDADLQDPPEFIPKLVDAWKSGYQVVYGIRTRRKESWFRRAAYYSFYRILRRISHLDVPLDTGDFSLMDRAVVDVLKRMPERNRFIRGLRAWTGFRQIGIEYAREERYRGKPKYTYRKLLKLAADGFLSFSYLPLRFALWVGLVTCLSCIAYIGYALYEKLVFQQNLPGWTPLAVCLILLGGIQLVLLGFVGEYIGRIYDEVRQRPYYIVAQTLSSTKPGEESIARGISRRGELDGSRASTSREPREERDPS